MSLPARGDALRVCIVGNSHLAALVLAVREKHFCDDKIQIVFYGLPDAKFRNIGIRDGQLVTPDAQQMKALTGTAAVRLNDLDALVFHGGTVNLTSLIASLRRPHKDIRMFSAGFLSDGIREWLSEWHATSLLRAVQPHFAGRILVSPQPLISEASGYYNGFNLEAAELAYLEGILAGIYRELGAEYVPLPKETLAENKYTMRAFSVGSARLLRDMSIQHEKSENAHMNAKYGEIVLRHISAQLRGESLPP